MTCHWGLASDGNVGLCGSPDGARRTAVRLIDCQYCRNIIDRWLSDNVTVVEGRPELKKLILVRRTEDDWIAAEPYGEPDADGAIVATVFGWAASNTFKKDQWRRP